MLKRVHRQTGPGADIDIFVVDMVRGHYEASLDFYGRDLGKRVIRKHLGWYMDRAHTPAALRREVLSSADPARVRALLPAALEHRAEAA